MSHFELCLSLVNVLWLSIETLIFECIQNIAYLPNYQWLWGLAISTYYAFSCIDAIFSWLIQNHVLLCLYTLCIIIKLSPGSQVLGSYSDGLCRYLLDMLCVAKGVCKSCVNAVAVSCIRKTPCRSIYGDIKSMSHKLVQIIFDFLIMRNVMNCSLQHLAINL